MASQPPAKIITTPQLLRRALYLTWGTSVLLLITTLSSVQAQRNALKTIGQDAAPSIIAAQHIKAALADLDANAANELLAKPGQNPVAVKAYDARRKEAIDSMITAAENITYGEAERGPIKTLIVGLGDYRTKVHDARTAHEQGNTAEKLKQYQAAIAILDNTLLPAANALDRTNLSELDKTYRQERFTSGGALFFVILSSLGLIGSLVVLQLWLSRKTNRTLNPLLLVATAIALLFSVHTVRSLIWASDSLKVAKEDAFTSIHSLWQARATVYSANGDESRYLLDSAQAQIHEQAFFSKVNQTIGTPPTDPLPEDATLNEWLNSSSVRGLTGSLGNALTNITFQGERAALMTTITSFQTYLNLDRQIRKLNTTDQRSAAIALCIGSNPGQSNWAFDRFDQALGNTIQINQRQFDQAIQQGFKSVEGFEIIAPIAIAAIAALTLFGLTPRLKEYQ
jgi:hypothetical protein